MLWEIATLAEQPYQGFTNDEVHIFIIDTKLLNIYISVFEWKVYRILVIMNYVQLIIDTGD